MTHSNPVHEPPGSGAGHCMVELAYNVLREAPFVDLYLGEKRSLMSGVDGQSDPVPVPQEARQAAFELRRQCIEANSRHGKREFALRFKSDTYRVSILESISETVFVLRRFPSFVPDFEDLGMSSGYISRLLSPGISGLVMIAGAYGQGKTTTASALVKKRLEMFGGVAVTIEDPPEMPLDGEHQDGVCYQTWVDEKGFAQSCKNAARWAPHIIFMGEIRDGEAANEALRAAMNGRLVLCTFHAENVIVAMERLYSMAATANNGSAEDITSMMSHSLYAVINQKLVFAEGSTSVGRNKTLKTEALFMREPNDTSVRSLIRNRNFPQLSSEITRQSNLLLMEHSAKKAFSR